MWQWKTFLADLGKDIEGRFGSVRWPVWPEQIIHEQDVGDKASQVGMSHTVESFPCQAEELHVLQPQSPRQWGDIKGFKSE